MCSREKCEKYHYQSFFVVKLNTGGKIYYFINGGKNLIHTLELINKQVCLYLELGSLSLVPEP